ncbi:MAG: PLP-dependent aminotransferase family protein [Granulosicoccus sp.]
MATMLDNQSVLDSPDWTLRLKPESRHELSKVRQLYLALYEAITSGELTQEQRLPSSRDLATQLGIGRNTVIAAYGQLDDECLISSSGRRGTRVTYSGAYRSTTTTDNNTKIIDQPARTTSRKSRYSLQSSSGGPLLAPGMPDPELFPQSAWRKALNKASRLPPDELGYKGLPLPQLQSAVARFLAIYRSLRVDPEQIIITSGTRQSLNLAATLYTDPGACAWLESPGYRGAAEAFHLHGLTLKAMTVDTHGSRPPNPALQSTPSLIYLTPCFQYPSGVALTADRREQFLRHAKATGAVIFEDDYDSEFRDASEARPALASQTIGNTAPTVLHAGTFSKLIFPAARVAWLVVPREHASQAQQCLQMLGGGHNSVAQATVAELLANGAVSRHLQRARGVYARRRAALIDALNATDLFHTLEDTGGSLSMITTLKTSVDASRLSQALQKRSLGVQTLESLTWHEPSPGEVGALVLGLGNVKTLMVPETVDLLADAIKMADLPCSVNNLTANSTC